MKIALAGNPNSGKTTMFNALTGQNERVGNWAGVTVDKKEHNIKRSFYEGDETLVAVDLPGAYSMSPFTAEESVTREYVQNASPDVIINIVDATNLSRSLFFTTQLLELGIPMVVALNKTDINEQKHNEISAPLLSEKLGCPVVETVSTSADGLTELVKAAISVRGTVQSAPYVQTREVTDKDSAVAADRDRFKFVGSIVVQVETRRTLTREIGIGDKIDEYITSKWLGIPIFAVVMFFVFQISQVWVGAPVADLLTGALGSFQEWIGSLLEGANPVLYSLLVDGV
ncbi:MAG: ferrous iron transporter B, partial [Clostridia bacterium]|nr:ferrous iron transporter B [Clostridia bacterium]